MTRLKNLVSFILRRTFELIVLGSSPRVYCFLLNLRGVMVGNKTSFAYDPKKLEFSVKEGKYSLTFSEEVTNYTSYHNGISNRREYLKSTYLLQHIKFCEGDQIVDCGANVGDFYLCFSNLNMPVKYLGIEPSPREFSHLNANVGSGSNLNVGLWNKNTEIEFYISSGKADSSFIKPRTHTELLRVAARRLDSLLPDKQIKLLKLEAEGAEFEAIEGAQGILKNIEYISADLGEESTSGSALPPVVNFLLSNNFEIVDFGFHRTVVLFRNKSY